MPNISIKVNGTGFGSLTVDGVHLQCVTAFDVHCRPGDRPKVVVSLSTAEHDIELEGSLLVIGGTTATKEVEWAMLTYLTAKYPLIAGVEQLQHTAFGRAADGKIAAPAASDAVVRELVEIRRLLQRQEEASTAIAR
jgi:hypothetical protein